MKRFVTLVILAASLLLCGCREKMMGYPYDRVTLSLPESLDFQKFDTDNFDYCLLSDSTGIGVWVAHYSLAWLSEMGFGDYTTEDFIYVIGHDYDTLLYQQTDDYYVKAYVSKEGDYDIYNYNVIYPVRDGYWRIIFDCYNEDAGKYEKKFAEWAKLIVISNQ